MMLRLTFGSKLCSLSSLQSSIKLSQQTYITCSACVKNQSTAPPWSGQQNQAFPLSWQRHAYRLQPGLPAYHPKQGLATQGDHNNNTDKNLPQQDTAAATSSTTRKDFSKIDLEKAYNENIFIEPIQAIVEYSLDQKDIEQLKTFTRRWDEIPGKDSITVLRRRDVENKAIEVWGSLEKMQQENDRLKTNPTRKKVAEMMNRLKKTFAVYPESEQILLMEDSEFFHDYVPEHQVKKHKNIFTKGTGRVVLAAVCVNGFNFFTKLIAWMYSGSYSMFAEVIHSAADTVNQCFLLFGIHQSLKEADSDHPYGWANIRNVTSLISGVGIFCFGAGFSIYHGIEGLIYANQGVEMTHSGWALLMLFSNLLMEGSTCVLAMREIRASATKRGMSAWDFVRSNQDPNVNVVLLEDAAAVMGVGIAATAISLQRFCGMQLADPIGSLIIGGLLGAVGYFIIRINADYLVGRSIPVEQKLALVRQLESDRIIRMCYDIKATEMGGQGVKFKAEVDIDGKEITRIYLEKFDFESALLEARHFKDIGDLEMFMLKHGELIVDTVGQQIDRIEKDVKRKHPEVRHIDLEQN